jgi:hypothetical protein
MSRLLTFPHLPYAAVLVREQKLKLQIAFYFLYFAFLIVHAILGSCHFFASFQSSPSVTVLKIQFILLP